MRVTDVMKQSAYWGGRVDNAAEVAGKSRYLLGTGTLETHRQPHSPLGKAALDAWGQLRAETSEKPLAASPFSQSD